MKKNPESETGKNRKPENIPALHDEEESLQFITEADLYKLKHAKKEIPQDTGKKITVSKHDFEMLVSALEEKNADLAQLKKGIMSALDMLGLVDKKTGLIDEDYLTGKKNVFKPILAQVTDTGLKLTAIMARAPVVSVKYKEEMAQKFSFMKDVLPILIKYGSTKK